jgi:hypothetical protein
MIVAGMTFIIGSIFLKETHNTRIWAEAGVTAATLARE